MKESQINEESIKDVEERVRKYLGKDYTVGSYQKEKVYVVTVNDKDFFEVNEGDNLTDVLVQVDNGFNSTVSSQKQASILRRAGLYVDLNVYQGIINNSRESISCLDKSKVYANTEDLSGELLSYYKEISGDNLSKRVASMQQRISDFIETIKKSLKELDEVDEEIMNDLQKLWSDFYVEEYDKTEIVISDEEIDDDEDKITTMQYLQLLLSFAQETGKGFSEEVMGKIMDGIDFVNEEDKAQVMELYQSNNVRAATVLLMSIQAGNSINSLNEQIATLNQELSREENKTLYVYDDLIYGTITQAEVTTLIEKHDETVKDLEEQLKTLNSQLSQLKIDKYQYEQSYKQWKYDSLMARASEEDEGFDNQANKMIDFYEAYLIYYNNNIEDYGLETEDGKYGAIEFQVFKDSSILKAFKEQLSEEDRRRYASVFRLDYNEVAHLEAVERLKEANLLTGDIEDGFEYVAGTNSTLEFSAYQYLSSDQLKAYNYLYTTKGEEEAYQFLKDFEDLINQGSGYEKAEKAFQAILSGDDVNKALGFINSNIKGIGLGLEQWFDSVSSIFETDGVINDSEYGINYLNQMLQGASYINPIDAKTLKAMEIDTTIKEKLNAKLQKGETVSYIDIMYASQSISEVEYNNWVAFRDNSEYSRFCNEQTEGYLKALGYGFNAGVSVGNMIPSIVGSAFSGGLTGSASVGKGVGLGLMFLNVAASSKNEAIRAGTDKGMAYLYGVLNGTSEVATEYFLGAIPGVSKFDNWVKTVANGTSGQIALMGLLSLFVINPLQEIAEEELQAFVLDPFVNNVAGISNEDGMDPVQKALDIAISTYISTFELQIGPTIINTGAGIIRNNQVEMEVSLRGVDLGIKTGDLLKCLDENGKLDRTKLGKIVEAKYQADVESRTYSYKDSETGEPITMSYDQVEANVYLGVDLLEFSEGDNFDILRSNPKIMMSAVHSNPYNLQYASEELQNNPEIVMTAVKQNGKALQYASEELRNNSEIVMAAVTHNAEALQYASAEIALTMIKQEPGLLSLLSKDIVKSIVAKDGLILQYLWILNQEDLEIVIPAIQQNAKALQYASVDIQHFFEVFGMEKAIKLSISKTETVKEMLESHQIDIMKSWYDKTGGKFIPDIVVMQNISLDEADKFLSSAVNWSNLMRIKEFSDTSETRAAVLKAAYLFGVFDHDQRGFTKMKDLLSSIPRKIDGSLGYIMDEIDSEQSYGILEYLKSEHVDIDESKDIFSQLYRKNADGSYTLTFNPQNCPKSAQAVRGILEQFNELNLLTASKATQIFSEFDLKYDPDFREFLLANIDKILANPDNYSLISVMQREFNDIQTEYSNMELTFEAAMAYANGDRFKNVNVGNEKASKTIGRIASYSQRDFDTLQQIYNYGKQRIFSSIPLIANDTGKYTYEMLRVDDPTAMVIGNLTDCCQHLGDAAELCMEHSMVDANGRVFVVKDKQGNIVAQSWVWRNKDVLCFDNIEVPDKAFRRAITENSESGRAELADEIYSLYEQAAQDLIKKDETYYRQLLESGKITQEQYEGLRLGKVTVGKGYNDIAASLAKKSLFDQSEVARPLLFKAPVLLNRGLYTADSENQYILVERGDGKSYNGETLPVYSDTYTEYGDSNFTEASLLSLEKLEKVTKENSSNSAQISGVADSGHVVTRIAEKYGLNAETAKIILHPNFAIVYDRNGDTIKIGDLLFNTKIDNGPQQMDIEDKVIMQIRLALDQISDGKKIDISSLDEKQREMYNKAISLTSEMDTERGVGNGE